MYERDMPKLRAHALASPQGLVDVVTFVLLTIRQPFEQMETQMKDVRISSYRSRYLFGAKRDGYRYAWKHREVLHAALVKACEVSDAAGAIDVLTLVPSLGLVKAAFVAQCCGLDVGCLDTHNLARFNLAYSAVRWRGEWSAKTKARKIAAYVALCRSIGCARYFWDSWCEYVADTRGRFATANEVSAHHAAALGLS